MNAGREQGYVPRSRVPRSEQDYVPRSVPRSRPAPSPHLGSSTAQLGQAPKALPFAVPTMGLVGRRPL